MKVCVFKKTYKTFFNIKILFFMHNSSPPPPLPPNMLYALKIFEIKTSFYSREFRTVHLPPCVVKLSTDWMCLILVKSKKLSKKPHGCPVPRYLPLRQKTIWHKIQFIFSFKEMTLWIQNRQPLSCQVYHDLWWNQLIKAVIWWKNICSVTEINFPEE